jgi:hypothetical protein
MATCKARAWLDLLARDDGDEPSEPPKPRSNQVLHLDRKQRRRRALLALEAREMRVQYQALIQEVLETLPITDIVEAPRTGGNMMLANGKLRGLSQPMDVRIRIFASEGEVLAQIHVARLRARVTLPINTPDQRRELPRALESVVLQMLD